MFASVLTKRFPGRTAFLSFPSLATTQAAKQTHKNTSSISFLVSIPHHLPLTTVFGSSDLSPKSPPEFTPPSTPDVDVPLSSPVEVPQVPTPAEVETLRPDKIDEPLHIPPDPEPWPNFPDPPIPSPPAPDIPMPKRPDEDLPHVPPPDPRPPIPDIPMPKAPPEPPGVVPPPST